MIGLTKIIQEYGDKNIKIQILDDCIIRSKIKKTHNEITFGTQAGIVADKTSDVCFLIFMDREKVKEILKEKAQK